MSQIRRHFDNKTRIRNLPPVNDEAVLTINDASTGFTTLRIDADKIDVKGVDLISKIKDLETKLENAHQKIDYLMNGVANVDPKVMELRQQIRKFEIT